MGPKAVGRVRWQGDRPTRHLEVKPGTVLQPLPPFVPSALIYQGDKTAAAATLQCSDPAIWYSMQVSLYYTQYKHNTKHVLYTHSCLDTPMYVVSRTASHPPPHLSHTNLEHATSLQGRGDAPTTPFTAWPPLPLTPSGATPHTQALPQLHA